MIGNERRRRACLHVHVCDVCECVCTGVFRHRGASLAFRVLSTRGERSGTDRAISEAPGESQHAPGVDATKRKKLLCAMWHSHLVRRHYGHHGVVPKLPSYTAHKNRRKRPDSRAFEEECGG